jgi:hypothetical protein
VQGVLLLAFAPAVGVKLSLIGALELLPLLFVLAFTLTSLGVALAAQMKSMQAFQSVMTLLVMPMFFLSGALSPLNNLPGWMTVLTWLDPLAYGMAPIRAAVLDGAGVPAAVLDRYWHHHRQLHHAGHPRHRCPAGVRGNVPRHRDASAAPTRVTNTAPARSTATASAKCPVPGPWPGHAQQDEGRGCRHGRSAAAMSGLRT